jgi:ribonuclease III
MTTQASNEKTPQASLEDEFYNILGHRFRAGELLERALTHRSLQNRGEREHYERLEFLGDAVLDLAVAHLLLEEHPSATEGELSKMRAALVNTASLAEIAREIQLGRHIRLSRGELSSGGSERPSILADVFEAILGALYREAGFEATLASVRKLFSKRVKTVFPSDPKTELQEMLHALGKPPPKYVLEGVEGPDHAPSFLSSVHVDGEIIGKGNGSSKKNSQQHAASEALEKLRINNTSKD